MKIKSAIIALFILLFIFPALAGAAAVGKLTSVEGKVDITSPGKEARPAREGDALAVGDIIRSKSKSRCEVTFGDGNILRLAENTRLKITAYMFAKDKRDEVLNLFRGKIQNIVQKVAGGASPEKAGRYEIHTPTAVAGVRGTNFFAYHQSGVSGAIFKEGTGYGYSINRPQEVRTIVPGQVMVVTNPNLPPTVRPATTQEMEQHQKETAPAEKKAKDESGKKEGDDKKAEAAAKTDDAGGKKDDQEKKPEEAKKAEETKTEEAKKADADKAPESASTKDEAKQAGDNGKAEAASAGKNGDDGKTGAAAKSGDNGKAEAPVAAKGGETRPPEGGNARAEGSPQPLTAGTPAGQPQPVMAQAPAGQPLPLIMQAPVGQPLMPQLPAGLPLTLADLGPLPVSIPAAFLPVPDKLPTTFPVSPLSQIIPTFNPIQDQPVVVPFKPPDTVIIPAPIIIPDIPVTPDLKAVIYKPSSTSFSHDIDNAFFTGFIKADGSIDTVVGGAMMDSTTPVDAAGGRLGQGSFTNGTAFAGYFLGVPASANTAMALVRSIYVTSAGDVGFLSGPLVGAFLEGGDAFGGAGTAKQEPKLGATSIAPADLEGAMDASGWTFAQPRFGDITVAGVSAPLSIAAGTAEGEVRGITLNDGKKIGVWGVITNGGTYQNLSGSSAISGDFGDSGGTFLSGDAYHLRSFVQGGEIQGLVTLWGDLSYLDRDHWGTAKFDYYGYNAGGTGGFRSIMAGNIILSPLAWSANIVKDYNDKGLYTVDGTGIHQVGDVYGGLAGSTTAPWSGTTSFSYMGEYTPANGRGPYLWTAPIYSYNYKVTNNTTYDGGAFFGLLGGVWQEDGGVDARVYATYVSREGKAGILKGLVGGAYFPDVSMYRETGAWTSWTPVELGSGSVADVTALSAAAPRHNMTDTAGALSSLGGGFDGAGNINRPVASLAPLYVSRIYATSGNTWGLWQTIIGGTYTGTPADTWYLGTDYHNAADNQDTLVTGTETAGSTWSAQIFNGQSVNKIVGESLGFAADIASSSPFTWVSAGETVGSFNATAASWQAVQTMVGIETNTFLTLASTDAGRATLQQLNIPAVEVGRANLSGSISGMGYMNVNMNNVTFFANSTGGPPRLWATNGVTGSYDSAYSYANKTVTLSGNNLNANFNVKTWDTTNGKWLSTISNGQGTYSGTGSMNGSQVGFRGAAAGTITTTNQTFSGTAAGTAK